MGEYREWFDAMGAENAHRGSYADNMGKCRESTSSPDFILRLIGQKTCYKTAIAIEISMAIAVLSFLKEDRGWTKNVFRMLVNS